MAQWLGLRAFSAAAQVQSLARELRFPPADGGDQKKQHLPGTPHPPTHISSSHNPTHLDRGQSHSLSAQAPHSVPFLQPEGAREHLR